MASALLERALVTSPLDPARRINKGQDIVNTRRYRVEQNLQINRLEGEYAPPFVVFVTKRYVRHLLVTPRQAPEDEIFDPKQL